MKKILKYLIYSLGCLSTIFIVSCTDLGNDNLKSNDPPTLRSISTITKDSLTTEGNLYNTYILRGNNLASTNALYINGYQNDFNPTQVTDSVVFFTVSPNVPWKNVSNKLKVETLVGTAVIDFYIVQPAPVIDDFSPKLGAAGTIVTITGEIFENIEGVFFGDIEVTNIISSSDTEIVIEVPDGVTVSSLTVVTAGGSTESADFYGGIIYTIYDEGLNTSAWWEGSWGGATELQNTEKPFTGAYSLKKIAEPYSALQVGTWTEVLIADYQLIQFQIYSEDAGTIAISFNGDNSGAYSFEVTGGKWQTVTAPMSEISKGGKDKIETIWIAEGSGNTTVYYIDDLGFI